MKRGVFFIVFSLLALFSSLSFPGHALAAVTYISNVPISNPATSNTCVFNSYAVSGANPTIMLTVALDGGTVSSVVLSAGLTSGTPYLVKQQTQSITDMEIWAIPAPSGSGTITVTFSGSVDHQCDAALFSGADQTTPAPTADAAAATGVSPISVTPTNVGANDVVMYGGANTGGDHPSATTGTCIFGCDGTQGNFTNVNMSAGYNVGPGAVTCTWGVNSNDVEVGVRIQIPQNPNYGRVIRLVGRVRLIGGVRLAGTSPISTCAPGFTKVSGGACRLFITSTAQTTWTVPTGWNSANNSIEAIGGGGAGGSENVATGASCGGGGGGEYRKASNISYTPSNSITIQIGQGGSPAANSNGNPGTDSFIKNDSNSANVVLAAGGTGGGASTGGGGAGGTLGTGAAANHDGGPGGGSSGGFSGGGGGGAGGINGTGGAGGGGGGGTNTGGAGGGGNGGGFIGGTSPTSPNGNGGTGGNNFSNTSSSGGGGGPLGSTGTSGTDGTFGGGGGGGGAGTSLSAGTGGQGGAGIDWSSAYGSGGGGGGGGESNNSTSAGGGIGGAGGLYGGGGGGCGGEGGNSNRTNGGAGANGIIVITYTP